ncbi:MAG: hypothetical protein L0099_13305 [Acidobacteria bacterium]|nr:hypothetical protein [Acidobacteriota bacterium]
MNHNLSGTTQTTIREMTQDELAALLRAAEKAHGQYERTLGRRDDDWPTRYAGFMLEQPRQAR